MRSQATVAVTVIALVLAAVAPARAQDLDDPRTRSIPTVAPVEGDRTSPSALMVVSALVGLAGIPLTLIGAIEAPDRSTCSGVRDCTGPHAMMVSGAILGSLALIGMGVGIVLLEDATPDRSYVLTLAPTPGGAGLSLTTRF